jgi:hypothetical protein
MEQGVEKWLAVAVVAGVVLVGTLAYMQRDKEAASDLPETASSTPKAEAPKERTFSWRFELRDQERDLPPSTHVALITGGNIYDLGRYAGSCTEIKKENLLPNEVAGVLCWWAGGGDEIGVFNESGRYIVKQGFQEEGTAEGGGSRSNFEELVTLE